LAFSSEYRAAEEPERVSVTHNNTYAITIQALKPQINGLTIMATNFH